MLAQGNFTRLAYSSSPAAPIRWVNQWDNMDGTIERGYSGPSIFFENNSTTANMSRIEQYAPLLSSVRLNGVVINNVNANPVILEPHNIAGLASIANAMRPWGVRIGITLNFASPETLGGLPTSDPLDPAVIAWWGNITQSIYGQIPDFLGFTIKASSEGQPGPLDYNRTLADGANLFADAVEPYGGLVLFRAFIYNQSIQFDDWTADRAKHAVDYIAPLDGEFKENVVVQIKYGPIDFQVREPTSPLFSHLRETPVTLETEVSQEYLGQQCHLVYLPPLWRTVMDFDLRIDNQSSLVGSEIVTGQRFNHSLGGFVAVVNVGTSDDWLGSILAMSNLYAFGQLAWNPKMDDESILAQWTRLSLSLDAEVVAAVTDMSLQSWPAYENYTGNLGTQTLTDNLDTHYGPNPGLYDTEVQWGQWIRANGTSVGMDRTNSTGTGYASQYPASVASMYEDLETTPDELLLWFHHVPWTYRLHSGETVIQHFYDAHYAGAEMAAEFLNIWAAVQGKVDPTIYESVLFRLQYQAGHSIVWRDSINEYFYNLTGIPDEKARVGDNPWRLEAETFEREGYEVSATSPFEISSGFLIVQSVFNTTIGSLRSYSPYPDGYYDIHVAYFDLDGGVASYTLSVDNDTVGHWVGDLEAKLGHAPTGRIDGNSAARVTFDAVWVTRGAEIVVATQANGTEVAPLDYLEFVPSSGDKSTH
ncbi:hypothetical protein KJ359_002635 [Pestalotiopsis sp. 9143b]|nr:hypothetical protein KJ359_002635 [Pestalotiopsis sp. 9143b]